MPKELDPWALGVAAGLVWTIYTAFIGVFAYLGWGTGEWVSLLAKVYLGFSPTAVGILIGCVWALVDGVVAGALLATFYNLFRKFNK